MNNSAVFSKCKELGCCDLCCLRIFGVKTPSAYEDYKTYLLQYKQGEIPPTKLVNSNGEPVKTGNLSELEHTNETESPPLKRVKKNICSLCLGVLQEDCWPECFAMVKDALDKKCYDCDTFACALSSPIACLLREKAIALYLEQDFQDFDEGSITPLKEAWKWSFAAQLARHVNKTLDSGAVSPLLVTANMEYPDDLQELEVLKTLSPTLFQERSKQKRRFTVEFTRRSVEQALEDLNLEALKRCSEWSNGLKLADFGVKCVSVQCNRNPIYIGGRYIKLSRNLPQTPWVLNGKRMMDSSVQEIIFEPIAKLMGVSQGEMEHRMKFMSAGREDVDVRCLGEGRPFAIEISDPRRELTPEELRTACEQISSSGNVIVKSMVHVTKEVLSELKKGEETKSKTYEALCIKLSHSKRHTVSPTDPVEVTDKDIETINTYRNTSASEAARICIVQKTPIRVLHRRPLLARKREILEVEALKVKGHPQLFTLKLKTTAGTYVKEWVTGELGRTKPALCDILQANTDILALDVAGVHLNWPPVK